ncbi:MAG: beta-ketoacyl synthase chain length factor [Bacteroidales bacterium]
MSVYINGIGAITPQGCFPSEDFLKEMKTFEAGRLTVEEPRYSDFIGPVQLRRMSKIIKMGLTSALMCLNDAGLKKPDAIITATGLGAVEDTDKFLDNLTDDQESFLNPTPFIQSTHNAVAARIAIETACRNYNMTYVHKNAAFEHALLDAILKINSHEFQHILLGGTEEMTEDNYNLKKHVGFWKENTGNADLLKNNNSQGTIAGEGSVFFSLSSEKTNHSYAEVVGTKTRYKLPDNPKDALINFLSQHSFSIEDIDLVFLGINGNVEEDHIYNDLTENAFQKTGMAWYKHLCGEYETASGFSLMLAARILKTQKIPDFIRLGNSPSKEVKNILMYQQRFNKNHSFTILSKC